MNKKKFDAILAMAKNPIELTPAELDQAWEVFHGIAYARDRRYCTARQAAWNLRYHCLMFNGLFDLTEISNQREYYKKIDLI